MTCQATSGQCPVFNVQGSLVCPVSNIHTFSSCAPWGNSFCLRQQAKCKSFIKHYSQNCSALRLCHSPTISLSLFQCGIRCSVEILTAVTSMLNIQADRVHPYRHARTERQRAGAGERKRWLDILSGIQRPLSCVSVCVCLRVCVEWQKVNCISLAVH